jgi:inosine-uridine nucleoside N-ribohydrolase
MTRWSAFVCLAAMTGILLAAAPAAARQDVTSVIVDTDAGPDDFLALAFLLSTTRARIEAVTITTGLAHPEAGAANVLRLLQLAGRGDVPVYIGRATPIAGTREFPDDWRRLSDEMPGVDLPQAKRKAEATPAHEFLAARLAEARPVTVLALGGLTNLAEAFRITPAAARGVDRLIIMGGALKVPGNLVDGGNTTNATAEWNFFIDPEAARRVFASGAAIQLVPLDVTQKVAIDAMFQRMFLGAQRPLVRLVSQVLATVEDLIDQGNMYAWDERRDSPGRAGGWPHGDRRPRPVQCGGGVRRESPPVRRPVHAHARRDPPPVVLTRIG